MTTGRKKGAGAQGALAQTQAILESISDGVFTVDRQWRVTSFNRAAEQITGVPRSEAIGKPCSEVFRASMCEAGCALKETLDTGRPIIGRTAFFVDAQGHRVPVSVSTALLKDRQGHVVGGAETFRDLSLVEELRKELSGRFQVGDMVSRSPAMRKVFDILPVVAASDSTVLIRGETGTGKELLARAIHDLSGRSRGPFVAVSCGALPDTLLESELFGYRAGAFTGADRDKPGRFARAEGGTLLLDEIGEVTPALQVRLLRVLQERTYEPLGGNRPIRADVRVLAATNRNLDLLVRKGSFRRDLFYRVNVLPVELPPLRQRREDVPLLVDHFVARFSRLQGKSITGVSTEVLQLLMAHDWPGNVRELENVIEHGLVLCPGGLIEPTHLPESLVHLTPRSRPEAGVVSAVRAVEAHTIRDALRRNHNSRIAAARDLGVHRATLHRKMRELGITPPTTDGRSQRRGPSACD